MWPAWLLGDSVAKSEHEKVCAENNILEGEVNELYDQNIRLKLQNDVLADVCLDYMGKEVENRERLQCQEEAKNALEDKDSKIQEQGKKLNKQEKKLHKKKAKISKLRNELQEQMSANTKISDNLRATVEKKDEKVKQKMEENEKIREELKLTKKKLKENRKERQRENSKKKLQIKELKRGNDLKEVKSLRKKVKSLEVQNEKIEKKMALHKETSLMQLQQKQEIIEEQKEKIKLKNDENAGAECFVCREAAPNCLLLPCRHIGMCFDCVDEWKNAKNGNCPTCRAPIKKCIKFANEL